MGLVRLTQPDTEPVTLADIKTHVGATFDDHDSYLSFLISVAREEAEDRCQHAFARAQYVLTLDEFPPQIDLPRPPVVSVATLKYRDPDGNLLTLDSAGYTVDNASRVKNWIYPAMGYSWPDTWEEPNGVIVTYEAGYTTQMMPKQVQMWIRLAVGAWYDQRAGMDMAPMPMTAFVLPPEFFNELLEPFRVMEV